MINSAEIAKRAELLVEEKLAGFAWKRGKAGGTKSQKAWADALMKRALAGKAAHYAIYKGWDAAEEKVDALIKKIDRNADNAIDSLKSTLGWHMSAERVADNYLRRAERTGREIAA